MMLAVAAAVACLTVAAMVVADPITPCEKNEARLADKDSCTRFHLCREVGNREFTTDIAICPSGMLFDMVSSKCINQEEGYVQDPTSCITFYGCHSPEQRGEGLTRRHYRCPGDLRFHPISKQCIFKTNVPDKLCNNRIAAQQILGEDRSQAASTSRTTRAVAATTTTTPRAATTTTTTTTRAATTTTTTSATTTSDNQRLALDLTRSTVVRPLIADPLSRPATGLTDLERITQVIKGQLLNRNKVKVNSRETPAARD
ncbi:uncharacterized protein [Panulirus ornatus]|uniref:uncharacterized protein n=1 Tax=Panulirus ornatus TaxID=150431 RepID=UPI003A86E830